MKRLLFFCFPVLFAAQTWAQILQPIGKLDLSPRSVAGCWHHVDSAGTEWALVGTSAGLSIVNLQDPAQPFERFSIPGITNNWREVRTWNGFAYVGSEALGSGITIVDLRALPDTVHWKVWHGDSLHVITKSHALQAEAGFLYVFGGLGGLDGAYIADLNDPWNPVVVGVYDKKYVHDGFIRGDTLWTSEILAGQFGVIDISDRTQPILLTTHPTPGMFNHNSGLNRLGNVLFTTDEVSNSPLAAFDVSNLDDIRLLDTYKPTRKPAGMVHNVRVLDDYLINPSYRGQLTIVDASRPENLVEIAWDSLGAALVWDADPYLPSGIVLATLKNFGLFVYQKPDYRRACWLEGTVTNASTGERISNAKVFVLDAFHADTSRANGVYKTGAAEPGVYTILALREGFLPKTIDQVTLQSGMVTQLDIALTPETVEAALPLDQCLRWGPSPFTDYFQLEFPGEWSGQSGRVEWYDFNGRLCLAENVVFQPSIAFEKLDALPAGQYYVRVQPSAQPWHVLLVQKAK